MSFSENKCTWTLAVRVCASGVRLVTSSALHLGNYGSLV